MSDVQNVDDSPDAQPSPPTPWRPPPPPTSVPQVASVWNRGRDQPTTVAQFAPQPQQNQQPPDGDFQPPPTWHPGQKAQLDRLRQFPPGTNLPPPSPYQPYMPPLPIRPHSDWGQPEPFANLPQQFELPGLYRNLGQYFGQFGAGQSPIFGILTSAYSNAYQKGVIQGNLELMKIAKEKLNLNSAMLEQNEQRQLSEYSDVLSEYERAANQTDPDKAAGFAIGGVDLRTAMEQKAQELNDKPLMGLLASGAPMSKVVQYLQDHEAKWRALHAANKKASETSADDALFGLTPQTTEPSIQEGAPSTARADDAPAASADAPASAAQPVSATKPESFRGEQPIGGGNDLVEQGGANVAKGLSPGTEFDKPVQRVIGARGLQMQKQLRSIADDPNVKPDQVMNEVKKINPSFAEDLDNLLNYTGGPGATVGGAGGGGKEQDYWGLMEKLATKAKPGDPQTGSGRWDRNNYIAIRDFHNPDSQTARALTRANTMTTAAANLLKDVNDLPDDANLFQRMADYYNQNGWVGDERYARVFADWQAFAMESNVLRTGGTGSVTETEQMMKNIQAFGTKQQYRAVVQRDIDVAESNISAKRSLWQRTGARGDMPGDMPEANAIIAGIKRMNIANGYIPGDVPPALQGATPKRVKDAADWAAAHPDDPRAAKIRAWLGGQQGSVSGEQ